MHPTVIMPIQMSKEAGGVRVGVIHALMNSIEPTQTAFEQRWPGADVAHLLDGSLYLDRSRGTADETEISSRIDRLIQYSAATGAEAILFSGSFFGDAVRRARAHVEVPVLTSFDGLVERALDLGRPLRVLSTAAESAPLLVAELEREAARRSCDVSATGHVVPDAMSALLRGDTQLHDRLIIDAVRDTDPAAAVLFAQFTMERVLEQCATATDVPVCSPASEGAARLRRIVAP